MRDIGIDVSSDASVPEALSALASIREVKNQVCVRSRFCQGDVFRQMNFRGADKRAFLAGVKAEHGENYYNTLRRYAWVAGKWPEDRRSDSKCWAWYVNNEPGRPPLPKRDKPMGELTLVSREAVNGGEVLYVETPCGTAWMLRIMDADGRRSA